MALQDSITVSATLAAAQEQLCKRRQQRRQERIAQQLPVFTDVHGRLTLPKSSKSCTSRGYSTPHSGWESQALSHNMRARLERQAAQTEHQEAHSLSWLRQPTSNTHPSSPKTLRKILRRDVAAVRPSDTFTLHPDLAIAVLQQECAAPGRVWLLLRALDAEGCGWVPVARARELLTGSRSPLRICGWRQMRNLLSQGDGIFWQRDDHRDASARIWLRAPCKVAATLGVQHFRTNPVKARIAVLMEGIGAVRAHFFTSFHSGRDSEKPIARETLTELTGVPRRSQRVYEVKAGVKSQLNWAVGDRHAQAEVQRRAAQHGHAIFQLEDRQGKFGAAGESYVAWQMPNSYAGPHAPQTSACKKRINRRLADLLNEGITGNGEQQVEGHTSGDKRPPTRYYEHGGAASRAYNQHAGNDHFWRAAVVCGRYKVWHILPAQVRCKK